MKKLRTFLFAACALFTLVAAASTEHTTVQGDHGFGGQEEQAAHIASDFLAKVLK